MSDWKEFELVATETLIMHLRDNLLPNNLLENAFLALIFRFREDLLNKSEVICKRRGYSAEVAQEIVERTFLRFRKYLKFNMELCTSNSIDVCFRLYLYGIARNELSNFHLEEKKRLKWQLYDGTEDIITEMPEIDVSLLSTEQRIMYQCILDLTYKHRVIYLTYEAHQKGGVTLPRELLNKLRQHLGGISQSTVRVYKNEAGAKIESARNIISQLKSNG